MQSLFETPVKTKKQENTCKFSLLILPSTVYVLVSTFFPIPISFHYSIFQYFSISLYILYFTNISLFNIFNISLFQAIVSGSHGHDWSDDLNQKAIIQWGWKVIIPIKECTWIDSCSSSRDYDVTIEIASINLWCMLNIW